MDTNGDTQIKGHPDHKRLFELVANVESTVKIIEVDKELKDGNTIILKNSKIKLARLLSE